MEETLAALLLSFDPEPPPLHGGPSIISCDRLTMTLSPTARGKALVDRFFTKAEPKSTHGHYKRAGRHHQVFIGDGLRWRRWRDARLDFNPSRVSRRGLELVAELVAHSERLHFTRVDVAADLPVGLRAVQPIGTLSKKAAGVWSNSIETIYIGEKNAARSFAIYDKRNELLHHGHHSHPTDELTRFEARLRKIRLKPIELGDIENPFRALQLLWLGGEDLPFLDRVLVRLARVVGVPILLNELPRKRSEKLRQRLADEARKQQVPHPRDVFDDQWKQEARSVLDRLGVKP